jgi:hypothetical protein
MCLVKDQTKRPTAEKLLKHSFFKHVKPPELSVKKLFADLPPLWNRVKAIQVSDHIGTMLDLCLMFFWLCCFMNLLRYCSLKMLHSWL